MPQDLKSLEKATKEAILPVLTDLLEGAEADLAAFGEAIARDLVLAAASGRPDLVAELQAQVGLIAEKHRLKLFLAPNRILKHVIGVAFRMLKIGLVA